MVKERLNAIDVAVSVANLRKLLPNHTLVNIYDITNRVFILKFSKTENKVYVLVEIGCRIHATQFLRSVDHLPSNFNAKVRPPQPQLRKHLRNRRLRDVAQRSQDRIIDFTFSSEEHAHHLIVQLFLPGNIYLTDHEYRVMTVLRPQNTGEHFFKVGTNVSARNPQYVFNPDYNSWFEPVSKPAVEELMRTKKLTEVIKELFPSIHNAFVMGVLARRAGEGAEFDPKSVDRQYAPDELEAVYEQVEAVRKYLVELLGRKKKIEGYLYKNARGERDDFGVFEKPGAEFFEDFNDALDAYFTKNELAKQEKKTVSKKPAKVNKIKTDQEKREAKLAEDIRKHDREIKVLEENIEVADNCLNLTKALIASGASWNDIYEQLQVQRRQNHPLVKFIKEINIPEQTLTFTSEPEGAEPELVVLDYSLNSQQNLKKLYIARKKLENKLERTKIGKEYAIKKVSKKLGKQEEKKQEKRGRDVRISSLRKKFWFEKFHWFVTSQGYLVLAGRDALQNELLVKRYLTTGDLYFHADIHGASSVIMKMRSADVLGAPLSENPAENEELIAKIRPSIAETANFAVCHSNAWTEKFSVQSWWVYWHQVSKTPPSGEYVSQGSFVIRGKKNYLQPQRLEMAITYLFQVHPFHDLDADRPEEPEEPPAEPEPTQPEEPEQAEELAEPEDDVAESAEEEAESPEGDDESDEDSEDDESGEEDEESEEDEEESDEDSDDEESDEPTESDESEDEDSESDEESNEESEDEEAPEELSPEEDPERVVKMGTVHTIGEVEADIQKRTKGRKATAFPLKAQLSKLKSQLQKLNLVHSSSNTSAKTQEESESEGERKVTIVEPEKLTHTPEAVRKIRTRQLTKIHPSPDKIAELLKMGSASKEGAPKEEEPVKKGGSRRMMRILTQKVNKIKKKYAQDDEETQELRRLLTGSKKIQSGKAKPKAPAEETRPRGPKPADRPKEIATIDDRELENYMKQLACLSRELKEDDEVINVIPMCAPHAAVREYKHALKLVPGNAKKGTIATQSLQFFAKNDPKNAHYLKLITTDQLTLTLIGNCKFAASKL